MQAVSASFHQKSQANVRKHKWSLLMSFDKTFDDSRTFFVLDSSVLNGSNLLAPVGNNAIQYWDFFSYISHTDRVISLEWSREIDFPFSIQSSVSGAVLNNMDNYYSSNTNSPISPYILPGRPIKLLSSYEGETLLQQFVGLTQGKPKLDRVSKTATFESLDYLSEIFKLQLSNSIAMSNVRTDQVIAALFVQFGLEPYQYSLSRGRNIIPFLFLEKGASASQVLRDIMQAEGGQLWIDEQGIIRFEERLVAATGPVFTFNESNISSMKTTEDTEIINRVVITSNIREVQIAQPIHAGSGELNNSILSNPIKIPANSSEVYSVKLSDPLASHSNPTLGVSSGGSWFTASTLSNDNIISNLSVTASLLAVNQLTITFSNTNSFDAYLNAIEIYGTPAKIIDTLKYEAFDQGSINKYGEHQLDIENDMFGSESNCESFAYTVLDAYSEFDSIIEMYVKGNYSLQLGDIIWVDTTRITGQFQIIKISNSIDTDGVRQIIKARRYDPRFWFILDASVLDGTDVQAP